MAARTRKTELDEKWKEKIKAGVIMDRLLRHVNGDIEMSTTQINAAKILLGKIIPDLKSSDDSLSVNHKIERVEIVLKDDE